MLTDEERKFVDVERLRAQWPERRKFIAIIDRITSPAPAQAVAPKETNTCDDDEHPQCVAQGEPCPKHQPSSTPQMVTTREPDPMT